MWRRITISMRIGCLLAAIVAASSASCDVLLVDDDDEGQRDAAGHRAAGAALGGERLDHGGAGGVPQCGHEAASE